MVIAFFSVVGRWQVHNMVETKILLSQAAKSMTEILPTAFLNNFALFPTEKPY